MTMTAFRQSNGGVDTKRCLGIRCDHCATIKEIDPDDLRLPRTRSNVVCSHHTVAWDKLLAEGWKIVPYFRGGVCFHSCQVYYHRCPQCVSAIQAA